MSEKASCEHVPKSARWSLTLAAIGVVFGDIGTSPLYAFRECLSGAHGVAATPDNVMGVLSLIVWALVIVVTLKYLMFVMRADNAGEGGILALMALATRARKDGEDPRAQKVIVALGLFGAALLYGDGMITPAISVLSAVEGLGVATPLFDRFVVPITLVILVFLFLMQSRGTAKIGQLFGPIMFIWFFVIAVFGVHGLWKSPDVLMAINPWYALHFFSSNGWHSFLVIGSVFLAVTGGEALYADMGHFGRGAIRRGWLLIAFPALVLQYFGQGALLIHHPEMAENPFFYLAPRTLLYPMVALSTVAAVIASQAMLTGAFSLSHQAIQMGYLPHVRVAHTSAAERGQIYVPVANWAMLFGTLWIVLEFQSSSRLAAAYGIAVTLTMIITTLLTYRVARDTWKWSMPLAMGVMIFFFIPDLLFFGANALKIFHGGWLPLFVASIVFFLMRTWRRGRTLLAARLQESSTPDDEFFKVIAPRAAARIPGTGAYLSPSDKGTPIALLQNFRHNRVLHNRVVLLTLLTKDVPYVDSKDSIQITDLGNGGYRVIGWHGFMESADVPSTLQRSGVLEGPAEDVTYFLGRRTIVATELPGMPVWREKVFAFLARNSQIASSYFRLRSDQVIEIGSVVDI